MGALFEAMRVDIINTGDAKVVDLIAAFRTFIPFNKYGGMLGVALSITDVNNPDSPNFIATVTIDTYQNDTEQAYSSGLLSGTMADAGVMATVRGLFEAGLDTQAKQNAELLFRTLRIAHTFCLLMDVLGQGNATSPKTPNDAFTMLQDTIIGDYPALAVVPLFAPHPPPLYYGVC